MYPILLLISSVKMLNKLCVSDQSCIPALQILLDPVENYCTMNVHLLICFFSHLQTPEKNICKWYISKWSTLTVCLCTHILFTHYRSYCLITVQQSYQDKAMHKPRFFFFLAHRTVSIAAEKLAYRHLQPV